jgi:hypothetical protein
VGVADESSCGGLGDEYDEKHVGHSKTDGFALSGDAHEDQQCQKDDRTADEQFQDRRLKREHCAEIRRALCLSGPVG